MTKATIVNTINDKVRAVLTYFLALLARFILYIVTPGYFIMWIAYILPDIATFYKMGIVNMTILFLIPSFFFINALGNMVLAVMTESKARLSDTPRTGDNFCETCKAYHPPNTWFCPICNACILGREQHCWIFERCIGIRNRRYYVLYLMYSSLICFTCGFITLIYLLDLFGPFDLMWEIAKVIAQTSPFNLDPLRVRRKMNQNTLFFFVSFLVVELVGPLAYYHMKNILEGLTVHERKMGKQGSGDWRDNMGKVFGPDWCSAIVWSFTESHMSPQQC